MDGHSNNLGQKRRVSDGLADDHFSDYYTNRYRAKRGAQADPCRRNNDELHIMDVGKSPNKDETHIEESFCSNFVCCGVHLADLHALLQHYEDVHVKVQTGGVHGEPYEDEDQELDVVGDVTPVPKQARLSVTQPEAGRTMKRTDSVLSAADALLGVAATTYQYRPSSADGMPMYPGGYEFHPQMHQRQPPPPQMMYYAAPAYCQPPAQPGREAVSAFDTTILRTVSPAMAAQGYPQAGYPYYQQPYYLAPMYIPQHPMAPPPHHPHHHMHSGSSSGSASANGQKVKRPRSTPAVPNMRAVQAASSMLRETLPAAIAGQDQNQFKLIYSILSSTMDNPSGPASGHPSRDTLLDDSMGSVGGPSAAEALMSMDPKGGSKHAAAILALPRQPIDKTLERPYICPVPGCGKSYKNPNGLKYHALHGHDGTNELVERPYKCPYGDCGKRYKNPNGLKYHVNKNHADMLPKSAVMAKAAAAAKAKTAAAADEDSDAHDHSDHDLLEQHEPDDE